MRVNTDLLELMVCPQCQGKLIYQEAENQLVCQKCKLGYEIKEGIPIMLVEEAKKLA